MFQEDISDLVQIPSMIWINTLGLNIHGARESEESQSKSHTQPKQSLGSEEVLLGINTRR